MLQEAALHAAGINLRTDVPAVAVRAHTSAARPAVAAADDDAAGILSQSDGSEVVGADVAAGVTGGGMPVEGAASQSGETGAGKMQQPALAERRRSGID